MEFQKETCQEGALVEVIDSGRSLKVVEHLGGRIVQRRAQDRPESLRDSVEALPRGR